MESIAAGARSSHSESALATAATGGSGVSVGGSVGVGIVVVEVEEPKEDIMELKEEAAVWSLDEEEAAARCARGESEFWGGERRFCDRETGRAYALEMLRAMVGVAIVLEEERGDERETEGGVGVRGTSISGRALECRSGAGGMLAKCAQHDIKAIPMMRSKKWY
jgi:hypothetical protein